MKLEQADDRVRQNFGQEVWVSLQGKVNVNCEQIVENFPHAYACRQADSDNNSNVKVYDLSIDRFHILFCHLSLPHHSKISLKTYLQRQ